MDTIQIMEVIQRLLPLRNRFLRVFPLDKVGKINFKQHHRCIINTAPSTHHGEYWVPIYTGKGRIQYFDSYGNKPKAEIKGWI